MIGISETPQKNGSDQVDPLDASSEATLRFLRRLVTVLTTTMILGVITIVVLLVIRLNQPAPMVPVPAQIALPEGTQVLAVTQTAMNVLVVTENNDLLIFDATGTELLRAIQLDPLAERGN